MFFFSVVGPFRVVEKFIYRVLGESLPPHTSRNFISYFLACLKNIFLLHNNETREIHLMVSLKLYFLQILFYVVFLELAVILFHNQ
jgi:hypothetical protein